MTTPAASPPRPAVHPSENRASLVDLERLAAELKSLALAAEEGS